MNENVVIAVDKQIADQFKERAIASGIQLRALPPQQSVSFGARIKAGSFEVETNPTEVFELVKGVGPALVDGLFDTLEQFRDRLRVFINGDQKSIEDLRGRIVFHEFYNRFGDKG